MNTEIINFQKIKSPFVRETINSRYIVTPYITEGFKWVFNDNGVKAVDKLHGTNICVIVKDGKVVSIDNRDTRVMYSPCIDMHANANIMRMLMGVIKAIEKGYMKGKENERVYGELIGPKLNGNIHMTKEEIFVPFDYLQSKCHWKSWIRGDHPKTYQAISDWFRELPSLYTKRVCGKNNMAEGLVFLHPDGRMAKLRRDMFDWYEGEEHG